MKCPGCGQPIMMQDDPPTLGGERRFVDVETKVRHDRCPDVAALVDAARDLLEYVEADLRRDREERRVPRPGLGVLADDLRTALGALR